MAPQPQRELLLVFTMEKRKKKRTHGKTKHRSRDMTHISVHNKFALLAFFFIMKIKLYSAYLLYVE